MKKRRAIVTGIITAIILPILIYAVYFFSLGSLAQPNQAVVLSFIVSYLCWVPGGIVIVIWYFNKKYKS